MFRKKQEKKDKEKVEDFRSRNIKMREQIFKNRIQKNIDSRRFQQLAKNLDLSIDFPISHLENFDQQLKTKIILWLKDSVKPDGFQEYMNSFFTDDIQKQHYGVIGIRKSLVDLKIPHQDFFDKNCIPRLIEFALNNKQPHLQLEATWSLTNLCSGSSELTNNLIQKGIIDIFLKLTQNKHPQIAEQAIWGIGNISGDSIALRNKILHTDTVPILTQVYHSIKNESLQNNIIWVFSNLCRLREENEKTSEAINNLVKIIILAFINASKVTVLEECILGISNYCRGSMIQVYSSVEFVMKLHAFYRSNLQEYQHKDYILKAIHAIIGGISSSDDSRCTDMILQVGFLQDLTQMLSVPNKELVQQVCWILCNVAIGTSAQIHQLINQEGLINQIIVLTGSEELEISRESIWFLCNMCKSTESDLIEYLINNNILQLFKKIITESIDNKSIILVLEASIQLLKFFRSNNNLEAFRVRLIKEGLADCFENLQKHSSEIIYLKCLNILENYFELEIENVFMNTTNVEGNFETESLVKEKAFLNQIDNQYFQYQSYFYQSFIKRQFKKGFNIMSNLKELNNSFSLDNYDNQGEVEDPFFGVVIIYQDSLNPRRYIFQKDFYASTLEEQDEIVKQAKLRMQINHPNILKMINFKYNKEIVNNLIIVSAFYEYPGLSLRDEIKTNKQNSQTFQGTFLLDLFEDLLNITNFLKSNCRIHGDIRPEYISIDLVDSNNKLVDRLKDPRHKYEIQIDHIFNKDPLYIHENLFNKLLFKKNPEEDKDEFEIERYKQEVYSIGLVILETGILSSIQNIYDYTTGSVNKAKLFEHISQFVDNYANDSILIDFLLKALQMKEGEIQISPRSFLNQIRKEKNLKKEKQKLELDNNQIIEQNMQKPQKQEDLSKSKDSYSFTSTVYNKIAEDYETNIILQNMQNQVAGSVVFSQQEQIYDSQTKNCQVLEERQSAPVQNNMKKEKVFKKKDQPQLFNQGKNMDITKEIISEKENDDEIIMEQDQEIILSTINQLQEQEQFNINTDEIYSQNIKGDDLNKKTKINKEDNKEDIKEEESANQIQEQIMQHQIEKEQKDEDESANEIQEQIIQNEFDKEQIDEDQSSNEIQEQIMLKEIGKEQKDQENEQTLKEVINTIKDELIHNTEEEMKIQKNLEIKETVEIENEQTLNEVINKIKDELIPNTDEKIKNQKNIEIKETLEIDIQEKKNSDDEGEQIEFNIQEKISDVTIEQKVEQYKQRNKKETNYKVQIQSNKFQMFSQYKKPTYQTTQLQKPSFEESEIIYETQKPSKQVYYKNETQIRTKYQKQNYQQKQSSKTSYQKQPIRISLTKNDDFKNILKNRQRLTQYKTIKQVEQKNVIALKKGKPDSRNQSRKNRRLHSRTFSKDNLKLISKKDPIIKTQINRTSRRTFSSTSDELKQFKNNIRHVQAYSKSPNKQLRKKSFTKKEKPKINQQKRVRKEYYSSFQDNTNTDNGYTCEIISDEKHNRKKIYAKKRKTRSIFREQNADEEKYSLQMSRLADPFKKYNKVNLRENKETFQVYRVMDSLRTINKKNFSTYEMWKNALKKNQLIITINLIMKKKESKQLFFVDHQEDIMVKTFSKFSRPETHELLLATNFFIFGSADSNELSKFYLELYDGVIIFKKSINKKEFGFMNIENTFLKKSKLKIKQKEYFSIKFIKPHSYEQIFNEEKDIINKWYNILKNFCIMTKFNKKFQTLKVLGEGNFAKVYLVEKIVSQDQFAVKVFNKKSLHKNPKEKLGILNEITIMRRVKHPRILSLRELYEGQNHIYILTELCKGQNLLDHMIDKGFQPEKKALTIIRQVLEGLKYLHSRKIMHRDIKLDNILFQKSGEIDITIVDLGFATYLKDYDKLFCRCGTPGYIAPEILQNKSYNEKVDIFSTGVILYIILTGRMPFSGNTYDEIVVNNLACKINLNFEEYNIKISLETKDLLKRMLIIDPEKRISAKDALSHEAFKTFLSSSPLIKRKFVNSMEIVNVHKLYDQKHQETIVKDITVEKMPNRIEDLSPITQHNDKEEDLSNYLRFLKSVDNTVQIFDAILDLYDIQDSYILDLGAGTGLLSIASVVLGAQHVVAVEYDQDAVDIMKDNIDQLELENIDIIQADVMKLRLDNRMIDCVIMNPPFGTSLNEKVFDNFLQLSVKVTKGPIFMIHKKTFIKKLRKKCQEIDRNCEIILEFVYEIKKTNFDGKDMKKWKSKKKQNQKFNKSNYHKKHKIQIELILALITQSQINYLLKCSSQYFFVSFAS